MDLHASVYQTDVCTTYTYIYVTSCMCAMPRSMQQKRIELISILHKVRDAVGLGHFFAKYSYFCYLREVHTFEMEKCARVRTAWIWNVVFDHTCKCVHSVPPRPGVQVVQNTRAPGIEGRRRRPDVKKNLQTKRRQKKKSAAEEKTQDLALDITNIFA